LPLSSYGIAFLEVVVCREMDEPENAVKIAMPVVVGLVLLAEVFAMVFVTQGTLSQQTRYATDQTAKLNIAEQVKDRFSHLGDCCRRRGNEQLEEPVSQYTDATSIASSDTGSGARPPPAPLSLSLSDHLAGQI
jgi:hypothetical protein